MAKIEKVRSGIDFSGSWSTAVDHSISRIRPVPDQRSLDSETSSSRVLNSLWKIDENKVPESKLALVIWHLEKP